MNHLRIKKLKDEVRKNGFTYKVIKRNNDMCMYAQHDNNLIVAYEVFKIKTCKPHPKAAEDLLNFDMVESFPSDEEFGVRAWTYPSLEKAQLAFDSK